MLWAPGAERQGVKDPGMASASGSARRLDHMQDQSTTSSGYGKHVQHGALGLGGFQDGTCADTNADQGVLGVACLHPVDLVTDDRPKLGAVTKPDPGNGSFCVIVLGFVPRTPEAPL